MRMSRSFVAALSAAVALAIMPVQPGQAQGVLGESGLVGELEGATLQPDAARPAKLSEAPMLAERVKAGTLPPVEQRVPDEPLVIKPVHEIGTLRRHLAARLHRARRRRERQPDQRLGQAAVLGLRPAPKIVPSVARGWEQSEDGKTFTLFLRKGMKWSDGAPFTADDFVFWFEDLYSNKEIVPTPIADMQPQGKPGRVVKIDETTVQFQFDVPYYLFEDMMAGDTLIGGGQSVRQSQKFTFGAYSPEALPEAVPAEDTLRRGGQRQGQGGRLRELGAAPALQEGLGAQSGAADARPLEDGPADQHAHLGARAQPLLLGGRHRGQPAPLHRPGAADAGRESRGAEPARRSPASTTCRSGTSTSASCR